MDRLIAFVAEAGVGKVVYTPAKIVRPKHGDMHPLMRSMLRLYRRLSGSERLPFRGGSWRLPWPVVELHVSAPLVRICRRHGVGLDFCKNHLLGTT